MTHRRIPNHISILNDVMCIGACAYTCAYTCGLPAAHLYSITDLDPFHVGILIRFIEKSQKAVERTGK